jgi:hypothetical protein
MVGYKDLSGDLLTILAPAGFSRSRPTWLHGTISLFAYFVSKLLKLSLPNKVRSNKSFLP